MYLKCIVLEHRKKNHFALKSGLYVWTQEYTGYNICIFFLKRLLFIRYIILYDYIMFVYLNIWISIESINYLYGFKNLVLWYYNRHNIIIYLPKYETYNITGVNQVKFKKGNSRWAKLLIDVYNRKTHF